MPSKWLTDQGFGEEVPQEEQGLSWGAGKAGQAGKAKEGACPTPVLRVGGCHPPVLLGQVPTIQPRARSTSWSPPGAAVTVQVMMARRERREDAQHWGVAASPPLGEQPPLPDRSPSPALPPAASPEPQCDLGTMI